MPHLPLNWHHYCGGYGMKVGLSFGRCIRDIVNGVVDINDVVVVVARTRMEDEESMFDVVRQYGWDTLRGLDIEECKLVAKALRDSGKLHQPRLFTYHVSGVNDAYVWMDLVPTVKDMTPGVKDAWETYRMLLTMCSEDAIPDGESAPRT
jgi:hypothetical protein